MPRHLAMPCANLDPAVLIVLRERRSRVLRNANGARDLFAPIQVCKKMLAEPLARHLVDQCSRGIVVDSLEAAF